MALRIRFLPLRMLALALAAATLGANADYVGTLKPPKSNFTPGGFFSTLDNAGTAWNAPGNGDNGYRLKLGYKYSRYLAVQGEYVDFGRTPGDVFSSGNSLSSTFRSTGYGIDTVA